MTSSERPKPQFRKPLYQLRSPDKLLTSGEFELLQITEEDLRLIAEPLGEDFRETAAQVRARSTILRRLFNEGDIHKVINLSGWKEPITLRGRVLQYDELDPLLMLSCGEYRWGDDVLPGMGLLFGGPTIAPQTDPQWSYVENAELDLKSYLETTAFAITGTRVRRQHVISYVASKKAAHVSDKRNNEAHEALDHAWTSLSMTRERPEGGYETVNLVYLELLNIITAIGESESLKAFVEHLRRWASTAEVTWDAATETKMGFSLPIKPVPKRPVPRRSLWVSLREIWDQR